MTVLKVSDATPQEVEKLASRTAWVWRMSFRPVGSIPLPDKDGWINLPPMTDFHICSPNSGDFTLGLYPDKNGRPAFDRVNYAEGAGVATVTWGYDVGGTIKVVLIREARPAADIAPGFSDCVHEIDGLEHVVFAHSPMGFATDSQIKTKIGTLINYDKAAEKEVLEELGNAAFIESVIPAVGLVYPNSSFMKSWSNIRFVQVDIGKFDKPKGDGDEILLGYSLHSVEEIMRFIATGRTDDHAVVAQGVGGYALAAFVCAYLIDKEGWERVHPKRARPEPIGK